MSYDQLTATERPQVNSHDTRARVLQAREVQAERFEILSANIWIAPRETGK